MKLRKSSHLGCSNFEISIRTLILVVTFSVCNLYFVGDLSIHLLILLCAASFRDIGDHDSPQISLSCGSYQFFLSFLRHPLPVLSSIRLSVCSVRVKFSKVTFLVMCLRNFNYLFLILSIRVHSVFIFFKTPLFFTRSVLVGLKAGETKFAHVNDGSSLSVEEIEKFNKAIFSCVF